MAAKFAYYILVIPLSYMPVRFLYLLTDFLFLGLITVVPYRKDVIEGNLKRSFPEKSDKEIKRIKVLFYHHFTDLLAEGIKNLSISKKELSKRFKIRNPEIMEKLFLEEKSVILVSGHFNNWEWLITSQNFLMAHQAMGIGMPMSSKFWDKKINERRERFGMKVVHSKNFKEEIVKNLQSPIAILTLADQSPGNSNKAYWMNFLNQNTAVQFGTEQMAHEYNLSVVYFTIHKVKRGFYEMELKLITDDPKKFKWGEITERHVSFLEKDIKNNPSQWIWSHKRWKREIPKDLLTLKLEQNAKFDQRYKSM